MTYPTENSYTDLFSQFNILPTVRSTIVIPVKDEEKYIYKTLSSFCDQIDIFGLPVDRNQFEILVLANNCSDGSVDIIKKFQRDHPNLNIYMNEVQLSEKNANIGYVRRKLMESACHRLMKNGNGVIMTTDADTTVAKDWICQTLLEIKNGAEAVGGRIILYEDEFKNLDESIRIHHLKDEKYQLLIAELEARIIDYEFDPLPRHHQHFNGSFAITTDCYSRSGGVPAVDFLEDCAFFDLLQTIDTKIRHSSHVTVYTSARCIGRTQIGLSYQLGIWKNLGENVDDYYVESCNSIIKRLTQKRKLIDLWKLKNKISKFEFIVVMKNMVPEINLYNEIYGSFIASDYFGEWYKKLVGHKQFEGSNKFPAHSIDKVIEDLQKKVEEYSDYNFAQTSIR